MLGNHAGRGAKANPLAIFQKQDYPLPKRVLPLMLRDAQTQKLVARYRAGRDGHGLLDSDHHLLRKVMIGVYDLVPRCLLNFAVGELLESGEAPILLVPTLRPS